MILSPYGLLPTQSYCSKPPRAARFWIASSLVQGPTHSDTALNSQLLTRSDGPPKGCKHLDSPDPEQMGSSLRRKQFKLFLQHPCDLYSRLLCGFWSHLSLEAGPEAKESPSQREAEKQRQGDPRVLVSGAPGAESEAIFT